MTTPPDTTTPNEFKRLNFFTGFFTTARDWSDGQQYHLEKQRLHNRGLHTPGIIRGVGDELRVEPVGGSNGLSVRVYPGAALDGYGREIYLGLEQIVTVVAAPPASRELYYIAVRYAERETDRIDNRESPQYSGNTRVSEIPEIIAATERPTNEPWLELARIDLQAGATTIEAPADPSNPAGNQIDRRFVAWAGSVADTPPALSPVDLATVTNSMRQKRLEFAALDLRFPVPSAHDVRAAALTVDLMARAGCLQEQQIPSVLSMLAEIEQEVENELDAAYSALIIPSNEFQTYQDAVDAIQAALSGGVTNVTELMNYQDAVSLAAGQLSRIVVQQPLADPGSAQIVTGPGGDTVVLLDATSSRGFGNRTVVRYLWDRVGP